MPKSPDPLIKLLRRDKRYSLEAYVFVFEALAFAQSKLGMGRDVASESRPAPPPAEEEEDESSEGSERHLTGQELCEAIRVYALEQFGYMAKCVLNSWGVHKTGDFGEIVFNLIEVERMRKTPEDRREDFDDVFDFETGLVQGFEFKLTE
ncbi:MAG: hypothetical protein KF708_00415 [Pirellulales bacterium]|nr:hypothetical protein [Pirellulales bacterium]